MECEWSSGLSKKGFDEFIRERNPDVVCLQEVKLNPSCIPEDDFGYAFRRYHLAEKPGYSGTAVFAKEEPLSVSIDIPGDDSHSGEGRVITCEFDGFHLVNTYVPNAKGDLSRLEYRHRSWDPALRSYLRELRKTKPVILCGDLNVAHMEIDLPILGRTGRTQDSRMKNGREYPSFFKTGSLILFAIFIPMYRTPIRGGLIVPEPELVT